MMKVGSEEREDEGSVPLQKAAEEVVRRQPLHNLDAPLLDHLNKIIEPHKEKVIASLARLSY